MKISTLFDNEIEQRELKPIEFVAYIDNDYSSALNKIVSCPETEPTDFVNLKLIAAGSQYDIIAAWDDENEIDGVCVFLGHWNDGIVK